jgi:hypothetical protein
MNASVRAFDDAHPLGDAATCPIARFSGRLAVRSFIADGLLLLAGPGPLRRRALPANPKTAHSGTFNCGF